LRPSLALARACEKVLGAEGVLTSLIPPQRRRLTWSASVAIDLPDSAEVFVGRDRQIDEIMSLLQPAAPRQRTADEPLQRRRPRVVVVWGLPGVGKTELIIQTAQRLLDRHPDGCLYLDLRGTVEPIDASDAVGRLLRRLGIAAELIPADPTERCALYRRVLRGRRVLLVLDNPATAADIAALSAPAGDSVMLVASRRRLDALDEAHHLNLAPLEAADARVLVETLTGDGLGRLRDHDRAALDVLLAACGYLPLALRVVAARLRATPWPSLADLVAELGYEDQLHLLDDGERSITRTFLAACAALPPEEARLLGLLDVHPGATLDARVAAMLTDEPDAAAGRTLAGLVAAGLVVPVAARRYVLHDLVRAVARQHARATLTDGEASDATERLIDGYLAMAQQADLAVTPDRHRPLPVRPAPSRWPASLSDPVKARAWLEAEQDNLVSVCELTAAEGRHDACWRLAYAMRDHFFRTKAVQPWIRTHELALTSARAASDRWAVAVTLNNLGLAHVHAGRHDLANRHYAEALEIFLDLDDRTGVATTLGHRAWAAHATGDHAAAVTEAAKALALHREEGGRRHIGITLRTLGLAEIALGRVASATAHLREALQIFAETGLVLDESMALNCLGEAAWAAGDPPAARAAHVRAWLRARVCASLTEQARALRGLAAVAEATQRPASAARLTAHAANLVEQPTDHGL
jgi:tetratricopeptide (TPR) repeat protein